MATAHGMLFRASVILALTMPGMADPTVEPGARIDLIADSLNTPMAVGRLPTGELFVVESGEPGATPDGTVSTLACDGTMVVISSGYHTPAHSLFYDGVLYVVDRGPNLSAYDPDGTVWEDAGSGPVALAAGFITPFSLVVDPDDSTKLLVTELAFNPVSGNDGAVLSVDRGDGDVRLYFDDGPLGLSNVAGIASDSAHEVYFCDNGGANCFRVDDLTTATPIATNGALTFPVDLGISATSVPYIVDDSIGIVRLDGDGSTELVVATDELLRSPLIEGDVITFVGQTTDRVWRVDLSAYDIPALEQIADCLAGPGKPLPACECKYRDEDNDDDCDLRDFAKFQIRFSP